MSRATKYVFSDYLSKLLTEEDKEVVLNQINIVEGRGFSVIDQHIPIRASNGLIVFGRIDVYVNKDRVIFISTSGAGK
ncbi:MAG: hypothetical protein L3J47_11605 [Sulfurovum sp.]|nr:hypothetical protein [Sulfurovum sp.]